MPHAGVKIAHAVITAWSRNHCEAVLWPLTLSLLPAAPLFVAGA
jgi:hypothetical protein